jgi:hypothetical protein
MTNAREALQEARRELGRPKLQKPLEVGVKELLVLGLFLLAVVGICYVGMSIVVGVENPFRQFQRLGVGP